jgi:hypothetical protein
MLSALLQFDILTILDTNLNISNPVSMHGSVWKNAIGYRVPNAQMVKTKMECNTNILS